MGGDLTPQKGRLEGMYEKRRVYREDGGIYDALKIREYWYG